MTGARYADILQNLVIELSEQINVDIVRMKCVRILSEPIVSNHSLTRLMSRAAPAAL